MGSVGKSEPVGRPKGNMASDPARLDWGPPTAYNGVVAKTMLLLLSSFQAPCDNSWGVFCAWPIQAGFLGDLSLCGPHR